MVHHPSSASDRDRPPSHEGSMQGPQLPFPAMISPDPPSGYDPYAHPPTTTPPHVTAPRGSGDASSNIGSFQSVDHTLIANYIFQAEEVSRVVKLFQSEILHSQSVPPTPDPGATPSPWIPTPRSSTGSQYLPSESSNLIDMKRTLPPPSVEYHHHVPQHDLWTTHRCHHYPPRMDLSSFPSNQSSIGPDASSSSANPTARTLLWHTPKP
jgi:hypothetical protein